jgi:asparagine synthase (glutamine-hydrolysing)
MRDVLRHRGPDGEELWIEGPIGLDHRPSWSRSARTSRCRRETILHLYEAEGDACVEQRQSMFPFALWDRKAERLLLGRERLGIKPLYYAVTDRELLLASDIKAALAVTIEWAEDRWLHDLVFEECGAAPPRTP